MISPSSLIQQVIDGCSIGVFVLDEQSCLLEFNRVFADWCSGVFGCEPKRGICLLESVELEDRLYWFDVFQRAFAGESFLVTRSPDSNRCLEFSLKPLTEPRGLVCYVSDISAWRRREAEMQEAIKARDLLMSVVGHDLRTPIFQLNGLLYLLRYLPEGLDAVRLGAYLDDVEGNLSYLSDSVENLLRWANNQRDRLLPVRRPLCAQAVLKEAVTLLSPMAERKGVSFLIDSMEDLPLNADPDMMAFVMRNLMSNALKFSPACSVVEVRQQHRGASYLLSVVDHGLGLADEDLELLSKGINCQSKVGTDGEKGFGLGLRVCRDFVSAHGGCIEFSPTLGGGLTVNVTIPLGIPVNFPGQA